MRRAFVYFILVACCFTMVNCQKQCRQRYNQRHSPEIKKDEYNSVDVILKNFYVFFDIFDPGPAYAFREHDGDTIMVCGWVCNISRNPYYDPHSFCISSNPGDTIMNHCALDETLVIEGLGSLPSDFDYSKKCYVTGILRIYRNTGGDAIIKPNRPLCYVHPIEVQAINAYFE